MYQSPSAEHLALCPGNEVQYEQFVPLVICFSQCLPLAIPHPQLGNFFCLYSIFVVFGDSEGILFANGTKIPQPYAALVSIVYMSKVRSIEHSWWWHNNIAFHGKEIAW